MTQVASAEVLISGGGGSSVVQEFQRVNDAMNQTSKAAQGAASGTGAASSGFGALSGAMASLGLGVTLAGIISITGALNDMGGAAQEAGLTLNALSSGRSPEFINAVTQNTDGMVSKMDAAAISNRALAAGFFTSSEQIGNVSKAAAVFADVMGVDTVQAENTLIDAIDRGNTRLLQQVGVIEKGKDATAAINQIMAEQPGISSTNAAQLAAYNAVMEHYDELAAQGVGQTRSQADSMERLAASWKNLTQTTGEWVSAGLQPAVEGANNIVGGINNVNDAVITQRTSLMQSSSTWEEYQAQAQNIPFLSAEIATSMGAESSALQKAKADWRALHEVQNDANNDARDWIMRAQDGTDATIDWTARLNDATGAITDVAKRLNDYNAALEVQSGLQIKAQSAAKDLNGLWWGAGSATKGSADGIADLNDALADANEKMADLNQWGGSEKQFSKTADAIGNITSQLEDANQQIAFGAGANMAGIFEFAVSQMGEMGLSQAEMLAKYNEIGLATGQVTALQIAQGGALRELNNLYAAGTIEFDTYMSGLSQIPAANDAVSASFIAVNAAVSEAVNAMKAAGGDESDILKTSVAASREAVASASGLPETAQSIADGIKGAIDQINALPGAQLKLLPDDALAAIDEVANGINTLAHTDFDPAKIGTDITAAQAGVRESQRLLDSIKDKTVYVTVDLVDNTGGQASTVTGGGGKAAGGPVTGGVPYIVGEEGIEVFIPETSGTIVPHSGIGARGGGGTSAMGGGNTILYVTIMGVESWGEALDGLEREARARGIKIGTAMA